MAMPGSFGGTGSDVDEEMEQQLHQNGRAPTANTRSLGQTSVVSITEEDVMDDDENDEDYTDAAGHGLVNFGFGTYEDDDFDDEEDDDDDEESEYDDEDEELMALELAEAERLAAGVSYDEDEDDNDEADEVDADNDGVPQYTLTIDPETNGIYIVDSVTGARQELTSAPRTGDTPTTTTRTGGTAVGRTDAALAALRRLIGSRGRTTNDDEEDDDDDGETFQYGYRSSRNSATGLFPAVREPVKEGVELARRGLFGKPGIKYDTATRLRFNPYQRNVNDSIRDREYGLPSKYRQRQDVAQRMVPNSAGTEVAQYNENVYCGQYSKDGSFFYTCAQDWKIRLYNTASTNKDKGISDSAGGRSTAAGRRYRQYREDEEERTSLSLMRSIQAREHLCRWTITDADLSPDNSRMIWSSISPVIGMTKVRDNADDMDSLDDGDGQVALHTGGGDRGIWSIRFSADGREIVAGASSGAIKLFDLESRRTTLSIRGHDDDTNAVCFADTASSNVLVSGSDDSYLKVWDRRSLGDAGRFARPSGVLVGHTEGVTFVAPKGDGRYVISNGKDQTCKMWDLRMMYSDGDFSKLDHLDVSVRNFDYRYGLYSKPRYFKHPHDRSVMTYTGHTVLQTLIRCHFSPMHTTGQKYIYSGSYDGKIHIWNLDGTVAQVLDRTRTRPLVSRGGNSTKMSDPSLPDRPLHSYEAHNYAPVVRDVSWSPFTPTIMSSAWGQGGGSVAMHEWRGSGKRQERMG